MKKPITFVILGIPILLVTFVVASLVISQFYTSAYGKITTSQTGKVQIPTTTPTQAAQLTSLSWPTYKYGGKGENVKSIQYFLRYHNSQIKIEGVFGPKTTAAVKDFQKKHQLTVDGIVGPKTWSQLIVEARPNTEGEHIRALQSQLKYYKLDVTINGKFDAKTTEAVKKFQVKHQLVADGNVTMATWQKLITAKITNF